MCISLSDNTEVQTKSHHIVVVVVADAVLNKVKTLF